jgi:hypothetical protein
MTMARDRCRILFRLVYIYADVVSHYCVAHEHSPAFRSHRDAHCNVGSAQFQVSLYNNVD